MPYGMAVRRRFGSIGPVDFNEHAARFATICSQVYDEIALELMRDRNVLAGWGCLKSDGKIDDTPWIVEPVTRSNALLDGTFPQLFRSAKLIELKILPMDGRFGSSFGSITWIADYPSALWLHAEDARNSDDAPLVQTLRAEMFCDRTWKDWVKYSLLDS